MHLYSVNGKSVNGKSVKARLSWQRWWGGLHQSAPVAPEGWPPTSSTLAGVDCFPAKPFDRVGTSDIKRRRNTLGDTAMANTANWSVAISARSSIGKLVVFGLLCGPLLAHATIHDPRAIEADPAASTEPIAPRLDGLGDHSVNVTTASADSQYFFDQGLRLTYGFNHSEALRSFKEAIRLDPNNAMAYWGWALVLGPNLNLPMQDAVAEQAYAAVQAAMALRESVTARERAYIEALAQRYAPTAPASRADLDKAYADAMAQLVAAYPDDLDATTLYAAALMNLSPWNYWRKDGRPLANTETLIAALEGVIARNPKHPGALHYHIHAVEAVHPTSGERSADALAPLMPGAGHMVHMPSHIYMRVGLYADAYAVNRLASQADSAYIAQCNAQGIYPLNYYPHNLHFLVWAAMFQGRSEAALLGARVVKSKIPVDMHGNAFEWSHSLYTAQSRPADSTVKDADRRLLRGGAFSNPTSDVRSALRFLLQPSHRRSALGFRPARTYHLSP